MKRKKNGIWHTTHITRITTSHAINTLAMISCLLNKAIKLQTINDNNNIPSVFVNDARRAKKNVRTHLNGRKPTICSIQHKTRNNNSTGVGSLFGLVKRIRVHGKRRSEREGGGFSILGLPYRNAFTRAHIHARI